MSRKNGSFDDCVKILMDIILNALNGLASYPGTWVRKREPGIKRSHMRPIVHTFGILVHLIWLGELQKRMLER